MIMVHTEDLQAIEDFINRFADKNKAPLPVNSQMFEAKRLMKRIKAARYAYKDEGGVENGARTVPSETEI